MYRHSLSIALLILLLAATGCYHARITTGSEEGARVIEQRWTSSWVYGLVPPRIVETAQRCPDGVARVETRLSFVNQVVAVVTAGIYTPMTITVTCAADRAVAALPQPDVESERIAIPRNAIEARINEAFQAAARKAARTDQPVAVRFVR